MYTFFFFFFFLSRFVQLKGRKQTKTHMLRTTKLIARNHNLSQDRTHFQFPGHFSSLSFMQFILVVRKRGFLPPDPGSRVSRFWLASVLPLSLSEGSRKPCDPLGIQYPLYPNSEHRAYLDSLYHHVPH